MSSPLAEREINRARHSGLLNPTVFQLQEQLNDVLAHCSFASQLNADDLSTLPEATLDLMLAYLNETGNNVQSYERSLLQGKELLTELRNKNELLRDAVIKEQGNASFVREKCDALAAQQRQEIEMDRLKFDELSKRRLASERANGKLELEIRKQTMELERLRKLK